jgi:signal transduction histidine kinase
MTSRAQAAFRRLRWFLPAALVMFSARDARTPPAGPLTSVREVRSFSLLADREAREVDVQGVVTYFDAERGMLYLHDASGPGAFEVGDQGALVRAGGLVSLRGSLDPASSMPRLREAHLTVLEQPSRDQMPEPKPVTTAGLQTRDHEAQWVEVHGVLRAAVKRGQILYLDLQDGRRRFRAEVTSRTPLIYPWLPDSRLSMQGVRPALASVGTSSDAPQLLVPATEYLRLERDPPADPFGLPVSSLGGLFQADPDQLPAHRVHVRGTVGRLRGEHELWLAADGRELAVATDERVAASVGETVDVAGFATAGRAGTFLEHALLRRAHEVPVRPSAPPHPTLRTAAEVRRLSPAEAREARPIRLEAVVTYNDPETRHLFVQDRTAGIYVEAWRHIHRLQPGDLVEIEGVSAPGDFVPIVAEPRVRVTGRAPLPAPRRVRPPELRGGQEDSQWIEVEGVVRSVNPRRRFTAMQLSEDGVRFQLDLPSSADPAVLRGLVNARVRVRAVCRSLFTLKGQWAAIALSSPGLEHVTVLTPPPAQPFALPISPVKTLFQFVAGKSWDHPVRVKGTVTFSQPGDLFLRDESGGLRVRTRGGPAPAVGDEIDAVGFATLGDYSPTLQDAEVRVLGPKAAAAPVVVTPEEAMRGLFDGELVQLEARLLEHVRERDGGQLSLRAGPYLFTALLRGSIPWPGELRAGSGLRLTGVCRVTANEQRVPQSFQLLLRSPADIEVPRPGPWWTPRQAAWVLAAMLGVVALALAWVFTLRRHVRAQARIIWQRVKRETELQERQRMARELHDTLEQNLTGISLSLEAASLSLNSSPQMAEQHLGRALTHVDRSIQEVHRSVWALREESLEAHGLAGSLDEIGQQLASCSAAPITVSTRVEGHPRPFALAVENNLLHIGQEALTNAVKHGKAARIAITLSYADASFCLRVDDDGRGFDAAAPTAAGRLGLVGMRERALEMGGRVEVRSGVGRGTEVQVWVPFEPMTLRQAG